MDYFHYRYQCPYIVGTSEKTVYCEQNTKLGFSSVGSCRRFVQAYCAHEDQRWQLCPIAQARIAEMETKECIKKKVKEYRNGRRKERTDS